MSEVARLHRLRGVSYGRKAGACVCLTGPSQSAGDIFRSFLTFFSSLGGELKRDLKLLIALREAGYVEVRVWHLLI